MDIEMKYPIFGERAFSFRQFAPEGFGFETPTMQPMDIPEDRFLCGEQLLIWSVDEPIPLNQKIWLYNVIETDVWNDQLIFTYVFDQYSSWSPCPQPETTGVIRILEWFAGGFGGWKSAGSFLRYNLGIRSQFVAVEKDLEIATAYALTHRAALIRNPKTLPESVFFSYQDWVIQSDIGNPGIRKAIHAWQPNIVTISSPCPPWSRATRAGGLSTADGRLLIQSILEARWIRAPLILFEQVFGFAVHVHKSMVLRVLNFCGYQLVFQRSFDLKEVSQTSRIRWLAIAKRVHSQHPMHPFMSWPKSDVPAFASPMLELTGDHRQQTLVTDGMLHAASNPTLLKGAAKLTPDQVLRSRVYQPEAPLPTFMARYGTQHMIDESTLITHGYFGHFVADPHASKGFRLWHPAEIALIHGLTDVLFLPDDFTMANRIVGNMIATQHALVLLCHAITILQNSPVNTHQVFQLFEEQRFKASTCHLMPAAHGYFVKKQQTLFTRDFMHAIQALPTWKASGDTHRIWHPIHGDICLDELILQLTTQPLPSLSQITIEDHGADEADDGFTLTYLDTPQWTPMLKGELQMKSKLSFWYSADMPGMTIERVWNHDFDITFQTTDQQLTAILQPSNATKDVLEEPAQTCALVLTEKELLLVSVDPDEALSRQSHITSVAPKLFDQYGELNAAQTARFETIITDTKIQHAQQELSALCILAASQQAIMQTIPCPQDDAIRLQFCGDPSVTQILCQFWSNCMHPDSLTALGRQLQRGDNYIDFSPVSTQGVVPKTPFAIALAVAAFRSIMDSFACPAATGQEVLILQKARPLWRGYLHPSTDLRSIAFIMGFAMQPFAPDAHHMFKSKGKAQMPLVTIADLTSPHDSRIPVILLTEQGGVPLRLTGGGAKLQQKAVQQNAIATTLLEHGYTLDWTTQTVETLISRTSIHRLQAITSQAKTSARLQDILKLCQEHKVTMQDPVKPQSRPPAAGAPWHKRKKRDEVTLNLSDYIILDDFFHYEDGTKAQQLSALRPQANGICLMTAKEAMPVIQEQKKLSSDELAIIVIDKEYPAGLPATEVTFPAKDIQGQTVLLCGKLYQLGNKMLKITSGNPQQVSANTCQLAAITLYKEDWSPDQWLEATQSTMAFIRKALSQDDVDRSVQAIWGRSLRNGRAAASPSEATTIQVHATIESAGYDKILTRSGFNKLFFTPKQANGRPDTTYRVLWLKADLPKAIGLSAQTTACLGLVRGRNPAYGLRYNATDFDTAWRTLFPQTDVPDQFQGHEMFKIENLPFGTSTKMLSDWANAYKWDARPFRALGPTSWIMQAKTAPPDTLPMFNTTPLLIRHLPPRDSQKSRSILGPRPKTTKPVMHNQDPWQSGADPWGAWTPNTGLPAAMAAPPPRQMEGPIEAKFKAQDEKIAAIQANLEKMQVNQQQQAQAAQQEFENVKQREQAEFQKVQTGMQQIRQELDHSLAQTMRAHSQAMEQQFKELKSMFQSTSVKRSQPEEADAPMT